MMENQNCAMDNDVVELAGGDAERPEKKEAAADLDIVDGNRMTKGVVLAETPVPEVQETVDTVDRRVLELERDPMADHEESVVSVSSSSSRKGKLRLVLEMNIKTKPTATVSEGLLTPEPDTPTTDQQQQEPINVTVEYPEDLMVTVNAQVQKLNDVNRSRSNSLENMDESIGRGWTANEMKGNVQSTPVPTPTQTPTVKKILNSTFVRPVMTSTLIYPILEETEINCTKLENHHLIESAQGAGNSVNRSRSGSMDSSIYKTVLADNEFGNISAITKADIMSHDKASEDEHVDFSKQPSLTLNSKSKISQTENLAPAEKLLQALHVMARYRGVWGIYEDEARIVKHLIRLNDLLSVTDDETVHNTCRDEEYEEVKGLISYFILERRFAIRSQLLHTFSLLSQKCGDIGAFIFTSDIPVILANEISVGDYTTKETYDYAYCLLQLIASKKFSRNQCVILPRIIFVQRIGEKFYYNLIEMIYCAQKHYYGRISEMLFDILLNFHEQLNEEDDIKWKSLFYSSLGNRPAMQKMKQKFVNYILRNISNPGEDFQAPSGYADKRGKQILVILHDWIICSATRELFNDAELDILLVSLTHSLENKQEIGTQFEAVKLMHRILRNIRTEPSGMDRMLRLVEGLILSKEPAVVESESDERLHRTLLKKIYRILSVE